MFGISGTLEENSTLTDKAKKRLREVNVLFTRLIKKLPVKKKFSITTLYRNKESFTRENISIKNLELLDEIESYQLKDQFAIKGSKLAVLDNLLRDYKKGHVSVAGNSKYSKFRDRVLNKRILNAILKEYKNKMKNINQKSVDVEQLKNLDKKDLKTTLAMTASKGKLFDKWIEEYKAEKISLSGFRGSKKRPKKINRIEMDNILEKYQLAKKASKTSIKSFLSLRQSVSSLRDFLRGYY